MEINLEPKDYEKHTNQDFLCLMCVDYEGKNPTYRLKDHVEKKLHDLAKTNEEHEKIETISWLCEKHYQEVMGWTWNVS